MIDPSTIEGRPCATGNPEDWFADDTSYTHPNRAVRLCAGCPALDVCLEWAMSHEKGVNHALRSGVYGGMTPHGRAQLERKRHKERAA